MNPAVSLYRLANFFHRNKCTLIGKVITYLNRIFFSVWIPSSAQVGKNFSLGYWGLGIVIHAHAELGDNVTIAQNVTIGRNFGDKNVPKLGNDIYVGAGSVIFGEIIIGDNVIIGSNTVVNRSIPSN